MFSNGILANNRIRHTLANEVSEADEEECFGEGEEGHDAQSSHDNRHKTGRNGVGDQSLDYGVRLCKTRASATEEEDKASGE